jgi:transcriptional regulator with XRE-family HTH domain
MSRSPGPRQRASSGQAAYEERLEEQLTRLTMQVTDEITWQMRSMGLSRADLATRMGVSPGRVSQVLSGGENITLRTLAGLAAAVDAEFDVRLHREDVGHSTAHFPVMESPTAQAVSRPQELASTWSAGSGVRRGLQRASGD